MKRMMKWVLAATRPLVLTMVFCGLGLITSCTSEDDNLTDEELFEQEMTAAMADARTYGAQTDAFAREVAARFKEMLNARLFVPFSLREKVL